MSWLFPDIANFPVKLDTLPNSLCSFVLKAFDQQFPSNAYAIPIIGDVSMRKRHGIDAAVDGEQA